MRLRVFITAVLLATGVAIFIIAQQQSEITRLRKDVQSLQKERDSGLRVESAPLSNLTVPSIQTESLPDAPSRELLRLRGEVARLHLDLEELARQGNEATKRLGEENRQTSAISDIYEMSGINTNSVPVVRLGFTTNEVLAELRRVGAIFLNTEENYIRADILPNMVPTPDSSQLGVRIQLWFEGGTLTSKRIFHRSDLITSQQ